MNEYLNTESRSDMKKVARIINNDKKIYIYNPEMTQAIRIKRFYIDKEGDLIGFTS